MLRVKYLKHCVGLIGRPLISDSNLGSQIKDQCAAPATRRAFARGPKEDSRYLNAMAYAVTPAIDLGEQGALPPCSLHTAVQEQQCAHDWGSLPPDLIFRVAGWLHYRRDLPAVSQTCVAW